jgi:hypothetical protein
VVAVLLSDALGSVGKPPRSLDESRPTRRRTSNVSLDSSGRGERAHRRRLALEAVEFDERRLWARPLRQLRCALVERRHVRVAVAAERGRRSRLLRVVQAPVASCTTPGRIESPTTALAR